MAIQIQGNGGTVAEVDGTTFRALRVTLRPTDFGSLGEYQISLLSGTMAAGLTANSEILQARWTDATRLCVIKKLILDGMAGSATAFTAGFAKIDAMIARSWTADGSGGTAATITGNNNKLRTSHGTTLFGAIRAASTGALTAGTKTLDTQAFGQVAFSIGTGVSVIYAGRTALFGDVAEGTSHPIILAQNEGIVSRASVPATGTWQFGLTLGWSEVTAF